MLLWLVEQTDYFMWEFGRQTFYEAKNEGFVTRDLTECLFVRMGVRRRTFVLVGLFLLSSFSQAAGEEFCGLHQFCKLEDGNCICQQCPSGSYNDQEKHQEPSCRECDQCEKCTTCAEICNCGEGHSCGEGQRLDKSKGACADCTPGLFMDSVSHKYEECQPCPTGKHQKAPKSAACATCPKGQYAQATGSAVCTMCEEGTFLADSENFEDHDSSADCLDCPKGTYQAGKGEAGCTPCGPGKYSTVTKAALDSVCEACDEGTHENGQRTACENCPPKTFQPVKQQTQCEDYVFERLQT